MGLQGAANAGSKVACSAENDDTHQEGGLLGKSQALRRPNQP
jgi:hypothetical protein